MPPIVVYDANLLYPFHTRNILIQLGVNGFVEPRWTDAIHDEWINNLVADGKAARDRLIHTRDIMNEVLPRADVRDYERHIPGLTLPDTNDRHVVAAAIQSGASIILTFNLKDFPTSALASHNIVALGPDAFLTQLYADDPEGIADVTEAARLNLRHTAPNREAFLDVLERQGLARFVDALRA